LTPVDVILYGTAVFLVGVFSPLIYSVLDSNAAEFTVGSGLVWQLIVPAVIVTILSVVYLTAVGGA